MGPRTCTSSGISPRSTTDIAICRRARRHGRVGDVAGPPEGVPVLELGIWVAVPSAAAVLADWGAAVIKIEPPEGDPLRGLAATGLVPYQPDVNPAFQLDNRGKRSVTIDLRKPEGRAVAHALVARSDVFLSNLRRQKLAGLGMDFETLHHVNPRLVYAGLTGYN